MKLNQLILSATLCFSTAVAFAQTGASTGTPFGSGQDSVRCRQNLSLFSSYAKSGSFQDAYEPWKAAYEECPASSKNIYIFGARILRWKIDQEKDANKKKELIDRLLKLYDDRVKYFGNDPKYGVDVIIANKISDYTQLLGANVDYNKIYGWAKPIAENLKDQSNPQLLYYMAYASRAIALKDESKRESYINDYLEVEDYLDKQVESAGEDSVMVAKILEFKAPLESDFAQSGLASCDLLKKVYTNEKIDTGKSDKNYLKTVCALFQIADCDAPVYARASRYLFDLEPSANAAKGLASEAIKNGKTGEAIEYINKAAEYAKDSKERAQCFDVLAQLYLSQHNYASARTYANKALAENPRSGNSLIILAQMIGSSASSLFPSDPVKQRCVYYLVIDKLSHAASVDPSVSGKANSLIAQYRRNLPSKTDIFMHPELKEGGSFTVPGYGTTTIR